MTRLRIGCSGWQYDSWRGRFYPERAAKRRWLELYAAAFDTVEVNSTFYRLARRDAVAAWVEQTPPGFMFTVKGSRYITHIKRLRDIGEAISRFYEPLAPLIEAGRLGPVLWQLPENFHRDDARLEELFERLPAGRHTVEFRHPSWFTDDVLARLREHGVALTIGDHPSRPFQSLAATAGWRFLRFHYGHRGRRGNYSPTELDAWAVRCAQWLQKGDLFAYFNNDWEAFAPANARGLARRIASLREGRAVDG